MKFKNGISFENKASEMTNIFKGVYLSWWNKQGLNINRLIKKERENEWEETSRSGGNEHKVCFPSSSKTSYFTDLTITMATTPRKVGYGGTSLKEGETNGDISSEENTDKGDLNVFLYPV